jgi:hypothetical protein
MAREKLILVPSTKMDDNKKEDRNENGLVRMSKATRQNMGFDDTVELYPDTKSTEKRLKGAMLLTIFQAFALDLKKLKADGMSEEDLKRVGFVTTKTFRKVTGTTAKKSGNIWITDHIADTVIGTDPEFLLFDSEGGVVRANNVLGYHGAIGCDGAMAEVRPQPAIHPEELVANITKLFKNKKLIKAIDPYNWMAGCYYKDSARDYPIGGHIHIGNPIKVARMPSDKRVNFFKAFNKILDEMLAIPMIKIDGSSLGRARRTECKMGKFGYFGEFRTCNGRLEHRTLSGMWLMHPLLAKLVFGCAKAVIDEVFRHVADKNYKPTYMFPKKLESAQVWRADFDQWGQIPLCKDLGCIKPSRDMIELLHKSAATKITLAYLKAWYGRMRKLSTYSQYAYYIDGLYEILKNNTKAFADFDKKIQSNWLGGASFLN